MAEETVVAESSSTVEAPAHRESAPSFDIPKSGSPEYAEWRSSGELPKPSKEASATSEEKAAQGESGPPKKVQEKAKQTAEERIAQLEATIDKIRKGSESKKTERVESSPAKIEPQSTFRDAKPKVDDKKSDGTPKYDEYEDFIEALGDWKVAKVLHERDEKSARDTQAKEMNSKVDEAKARYTDFADKVSPFVSEFVNDASIAPSVKRMVDRSKVFADLAYVLADDDHFREIAKDEDEAVRYIAKVEVLIAEELSGKSASRNDQGQFVKEKAEAAPVKRGPENTPKPPIEISQRGNSNMDEAERAFQDIGRGNSAKATRAWMDAENRKELARRRGA